MPTGGGTKTTSTNPPWLDKAGEENWNFAKSVFFGDPSSYYSKALAPWGYNAPAKQPAALPQRNWGANPTENQKLAAQYGYSGDFGGGQFQKWLAQNPGGASSVTGARQQAAAAPGASGPVTRTGQPYQPAYPGQLLPYANAPWMAANGGAGPAGSAGTGGNTGAAGQGYGADLGNLAPLPMYPGERVANLSNAERQGIGLAKSSANVADPSFASAGGAIGGGYNTGMGYLGAGAGYIPASTQGYESPFTRFPEAAGYYMNPFVKGALDVSARELGTQNAQDQARLQSQAVSRGAFGGSRSTLLQSEANRNYGQNLGDLYSKGLADAYDKAAGIFGTDETRNMAQFNAERDRQQKAAEMFRQYGATGADIGTNAGAAYTNLGKAQSDAATEAMRRLLESGKLDTGYRQSVIDADLANFLEQRDYPRDVMAQLASILSGNPSKGSVQTTGKPNTFGQLLGIGGQLALAGATGGASIPAGAAFNSAGMLMNSDRRLKTEVVKIGEHEIPDKGKVPLYRFRYAGDASRAYHTGVMADEIEPLMPEAVKEGADGMKMVNYGMIGLQAA